MRGEAEGGGPKAPVTILHSLSLSIPALTHTPVLDHHPFEDGGGVRQGGRQVARPHRVDLCAAGQYNT